MKRLLPRPTYANVVSTLCLLLLVGGGAALAASKLAKNSVGSNQIKKNAVTTAKIKNGAVTGAKIKTSSLGTVPNASHAISADTANSLPPPEAVHYVGAPGEPQFENGAEDPVGGNLKAGFYKDRLCVVHLVGLVVAIGEKVAFRLPPSDVPLQESLIGVPAVPGPKAGALSVELSGGVMPFVQGNLKTTYGLDGVTFRAASC